MAILFVSGVNDLSRVRVTLNENSQIVHLFDGNCSLYGRLPMRKGVAAEVVLFGKRVKPYEFNLNATPSLIFNQIADADTNRGALGRCVELCAQVNSHVINRPESVLETTRERVSEVLQGIHGVTMPRTVRFVPRSPDHVFERAESEHFGYPFIVRIAGDHGGTSMTRVSGRGDAPALNVYPFDGRDFYLTQYVDCSDSDGFYHRQRLVIIDGEPVLRGSLYDRDWKVHGASRRFMMERESWEQDRVRSQILETEIIPKVKTAVQEITNRLKLEFFGIDCSLDPAGEMLVFEANANMNILTNDHPQMEERMNMIEKKIQVMLTRHSGERVI